MTDVAQLLESRRSRIGRWAGAALIVCGLHAGGIALALMHHQDDGASDEVAAALTVDMAPLPAPVPVDSANVAHGPEQQVAKLTPEASKEVAEKVQKDIPLVEPSPAPSPEVILPKLQPDEKDQPKEERAKEAVAEKEKPPQDQQQEFTAAPPRVEAPPASRSAPSQGLSPTLARMQASWVKGVAGKLQRFKRYPGAADRRGIKGVAKVRYTVDRSGQVIFAEVVQSSGSPMLDEEALAVLKRASPLPAPPGGLPEAYLENFFDYWFGVKPDR